MKIGIVYIMTNYSKTTLYTGVTSNIKQRLYQHKTHYFKNSFSEKYNTNFLVYYEIYDSIEYAIQREIQIKNLVRRKKVRLITDFNPEWKDLSSDFLD